MASAGCTAPAPAAGAAPSRTDRAGRFIAATADLHPWRVRTSCRPPDIGRVQWDENRRGCPDGLAVDGLIVRLADPGELAQIAQLKRTVELETYAGLGTRPELEARIGTRCTAEFLARCRPPGDALFDATREAELIGMGAVRLRRETSGSDASGGGGGTVAHLHSLYCRLRRLGVGRAVTEARLAWARANGATSVTADCFVGKDAAARTSRG